MTRKHFEAIAAIIAPYADVTPAGYYPEAHAEAWGKRAAAGGIADSLADYFETANPNFDRERFLAACGF